MLSRANDNNNSTSSASNTKQLSLLSGLASSSTQQQHTNSINNNSTTNKLLGSGTSPPSASSYLSIIDNNKSSSSSITRIHSPSSPSSPFMQYIDTGSTPPPQPLLIPISSSRSHLYKTMIDVCIKHHPLDLSKFQNPKFDYKIIKKLGGGIEGQVFLASIADQHQQDNNNDSNNNNNINLAIKRITINNLSDLEQQIKLILQVCNVESTFSTNNNNHHHNHHHHHNSSLISTSNINTTTSSSSKQSTTTAAAAVHIVPHYDIFYKEYKNNLRGETEYALSIVMACCDLGSLEDVILNYSNQYGNEFMSGELKLNWMIDITRSLVFFHKRKLVHLDIKPDNILLQSSKKPQQTESTSNTSNSSSNDGSTSNYKEIIQCAQIYLSDFGLTREFKVGDSPLMSITGSKNYMAPEIFDGKYYNESVDMWALGIVALQLLVQKRRSRFDELRNLLFNCSNNYETKLVIDNFISECINDDNSKNGNTNLGNTKNGNSKPINLLTLLLDKGHSILLKLVYQCLRLDSSERLNATECLNFLMKERKECYKYGNSENGISINGVSTTISGILQSLNQQQQQNNSSSNSSSSIDILSALESIQKEIDSINTNFGNSNYGNSENQLDFSPRNISTPSITPTSFTTTSTNNNTSNTNNTNLSNLLSNHLNNSSQHHLIQQQQHQHHHNSSSLSSIHKFTSTFYIIYRLARHFWDQMFGNLIKVSWNEFKDCYYFFTKSAFHSKSEKVLKSLLSSDAENNVSIYTFVKCVQNCKNFPFKDEYFSNLYIYSNIFNEDKTFTSEGNMNLMLYDLFKKIQEEDNLLFTIKGKFDYIRFLKEVKLEITSYITPQNINSTINSNSNTNSNNRHSISNNNLNNNLISNFASDRIGGSSLPISISSSKNSSSIGGYSNSYSGVNNTINTTSNSPSSSFNSNSNNNMNSNNSNNINSNRMSMNVFSMDINDGDAFKTKRKRGAIIGVRNTNFDILFQSSSATNSTDHSSESSTHSRFSSTNSTSSRFSSNYRSINSINSVNSIGSTNSIGGDYEHQSNHHHHQFNKYSSTTICYVLNCRNCNFTDADLSFFISSIHRYYMEHVYTLTNSSNNNSNNNLSGNNNQTSNGGNGGNNSSSNNLNQHLNFGNSLFKIPILISLRNVLNNNNNNNSTTTHSSPSNGKDNNSSTTTSSGGSGGGDSSSVGGDDFIDKIIQGCFEYYFGNVTKLSTNELSSGGSGSNNLFGNENSSFGSPRFKNSNFNFNSNYSNSNFNYSNSSTTTVKQHLQFNKEIHHYLKQLILNGKCILIFDHFQHFKGQEYLDLMSQLSTLTNNTLYIVESSNNYYGNSNSSNHSNNNNYMMHPLDPNNTSNNGNGHSYILKMIDIQSLGINNISSLLQNAVSSSNNNSSSSSLSGSLHSNISNQLSLSILGSILSNTNDNNSNSLNASDLSNKNSKTKKDSKKDLKKELKKELKNKKDQQRKTLGASNSSGNLTSGGSGGIGGSGSGGGLHHSLSSSTTTTLFNELNEYDFRFLEVARIPSFAHYFALKQQQNNGGDAHETTAATASSNMINEMPIRMILEQFLDKFYLSADLTLLPNNLASNNYLFGGGVQNSTQFGGSGYGGGGSGFHSGSGSGSAHFSTGGGGNSRRGSEQQQQQQQTHMDYDSSTDSLVVVVTPSLFSNIELQLGGADILPSTPTSFNAFTQQDQQSSTTVNSSGGVGTPTAAGRTRSRSLRFSMGKRDSRNFQTTATVNNSSSGSGGGNSGSNLSVAYGGSGSGENSRSNNRLSLKESDERKRISFNNIEQFTKKEKMVTVNEFMEFMLDLAEYLSVKKIEKFRKLPDDFFASATGSSSSGGSGSGSSFGSDYSSSSSSSHHYSSSRASSIAGGGGSNSGSGSGGSSGSGSSQLYRLIWRQIVFIYQQMYEDDYHQSTTIVSTSTFPLLDYLPQFKYFIMPRVVREYLTGLQWSKKEKHSIIRYLKRKTLKTVFKPKLTIRTSILKRYFIDPFYRNCIYNMIHFMDREEIKQLLVKLQKEKFTLNEELIVERVLIRNLSLDKLEQFTNQHRRRLSTAINQSGQFNLNSGSSSSRFATSVDNLASTSTPLSPLSSPSSAFHHRFISFNSPQPQSSSKHNSSLLLSSNNNSNSSNSSGSGMIELKDLNEIETIYREYLKRAITSKYTSIQHIALRILMNRNEMLTCLTQDDLSCNTFIEIISNFLKRTTDSNNSNNNLNEEVVIQNNIEKKKSFFFNRKSTASLRLSQNFNNLNNLNQHENLENSFFNIQNFNISKNGHACYGITKLIEYCQSNYLFEQMSNLLLNIYNTVPFLLLIILNSQIDIIQNRQILNIFLKLLKKAINDFLILIKLNNEEGIIILFNLILTLFNIIQNLNPDEFKSPNLDTKSRTSTNTTTTTTTSTNSYDTSSYKIVYQLYHFLFKNYQTKNSNSNTTKQQQQHFSSSSTTTGCAIENSRPKLFFSSSSDKTKLKDNNSGSTGSNGHQDDNRLFITCSNFLLQLLNLIDDQQIILDQINDDFKQVIALNFNGKIYHSLEFNKLFYDHLIKFVNIFELDESYMVKLISIYVPIHFTINSKNSLSNVDNSILISLDLNFIKMIQSISTNKEIHLLLIMERILNHQFNLFNNQPNDQYMLQIENDQYLKREYISTKKNFLIKRFLNLAKSSVILLSRIIEENDEGNDSDTDTDTTDSTDTTTTTDTDDTSSSDEDDELHKVDDDESHHSKNRRRRDNHHRREMNQQLLSQHEFLQLNSQSKIIHIMKLCISNLLPNLLDYKDDDPRTGGGGGGGIVGGSASIPSNIELYYFDHNFNLEQHLSCLYIVTKLLPQYGNYDLTCKGVPIIVERIFCDLLSILFKSLIRISTQHSTKFKQTFLLSLVYKNYLKIMKEYLKINYNRIKNGIQSINSNNLNIGNRRNLHEQLLNNLSMLLLLFIHDDNRNVYEMSNELIIKTFKVLSILPISSERVIKRLMDLIQNNNNNGNGGNQNIGNQFIIRFYACFYLNEIFRKDQNLANVSALSLFSNTVVEGQLIEGISSFILNSSTEKLLNHCFHFIKFGTNQQQKEEFEKIILKRLIATTSQSFGISTTTTSSTNSSTSNTSSSQLAFTGAAGGFNGGGEWTVQLSHLLYPQSNNNSSSNVSTPQQGSSSPFAANLSLYNNIAEHQSGSGGSGTPTNSGGSGNGFNTIGGGGSGNNRRKSTLSSLFGNISAASSLIVDSLNFGYSNVTTHISYFPNQVLKGLIQPCMEHQIVRLGLETISSRFNVLNDITALKNESINHSYNYETSLIQNSNNNSNGTISSLSLNSVASDEILKGMRIFIDLMEHEHLKPFIIEQLFEIINQCRDLLITIKLDEEMVRKLKLYCPIEYFFMVHELYHI